MYGLSFLVVLAFASSSLAAPVPKDANEKDAKEGDYFPLVKGNSWEFTRSSGMARDKWTVTVAEVTRERLKSVAVLKCQMHNGAYDARFEVDHSGVYRHSEVKGGSEPPSKVLPYPLKAGATWESKRSFPFYDAHGKLKTEAKEIVVVEVPAGKFKAMEVVISYTVYGRETTITSWYAPGIGLVKQYYYQTPGGANDKLELTKFTSGK